MTSKTTPEPSASGETSAQVDERDATIGMLREAAQDYFDHASLSREGTGEFSDHEWLSRRHLAAALTNTEPAARAWRAEHEVAEAALAWSKSEWPGEDRARLDFVLRGKCAQLEMARRTNSTTSEAEATPAQRAMSEPRLCVLGEHLASWPCHCDEIKNYLATHPSLVDLSAPETEKELAIAIGRVATGSGPSVAAILTAWRNLRREGGK